MLAIIQARMSSKRLPGKVLLPVEGRPMLLWLIDGLRHSRMITKLMIATSSSDSDDPIASFSHNHEIPIVRGELDDVVGRFLLAAQDANAKEFIRINGDSPFIDPKLIDKAVTAYKENDVDLVTNVFPRSYPRGQSVEVIRVEALEKISVSIKNIEDREHVTTYFYRHPEKYRILNFSCEVDLSNIQLSVDSNEDFRAFERMAAAMNQPHWTYGYKMLADMKSYLGEKDLET